MLTYMEVHLYFTLPVLGLLFYLLKPFHSKQDTFKYQFLLGMAVLTASIWDNYIVYHKAWSYCPTCVVAVIGYVPLEEYMFFVIMTLMTVAFTNLIMRWHLPSVFIKSRTPWIQTVFVRFVPILGLLFAAYKAWKSTVPGKPLFYGSCILWYTCPVLALLWYGSGEYMLRRPLAVLISIIMPTLYLCWVDKIAIHAGVWHISLRTSTGYFVSPDLPVEEFMFFALINTVLVFATCALDRAQSIIHLFYDSGHPFLLLLQAFATPDQLLNEGTLQDLSTTWHILKTASKSFYTASTVFPYDVRQDLGVLYGFCRATDDLCDDASVPFDERKGQLDLTRHFVKTLFSEKPIRWELYPLPESCLSAFRAFCRLRPLLEEDAVQELLDGYQWDLECRVVQTEADLEYYSACVASSVGEMCTRLILHHDGQPNNGWIVDRAREMGLVLQYVNIARDIVTDSQELGRAYLPSDWLGTKELDYLAQGKARELGDARLMALCRRLTNKATHLKRQAERGIDYLPESCQGGVRAACNVYSSISIVLNKSHHYPTRAFLSKPQRALVALSSVYSQ